MVARVFSYDVIAFELKRFNQFDSPLSLIAGRHSKRVSIAAILPNGVASTFIEVCDPFLFFFSFILFYFFFFFWSTVDEGTRAFYFHSDIFLKTILFF